MWGLQAQLDEARREIAALRDLNRRTEARLQHVMEVHQNRLDEWKGLEADLRTQLYAIEAVWIVFEGHPADGQLPVYVSSSLTEAECWKDSRDLDNTRLYGPSHQHDVWIEEWTVDGDGPVGMEDG